MQLLLTSAARPHPPTVTSSKADPRCVRTLLEAGADPAAGGNGSALCALHHLERAAAAADFRRVLDTWMQHGLDPLTPASQGGSPSPDHGQQHSMLVLLHPDITAILLAGLEQQWAAGSLRLGSAWRTAQLVIGAARASSGERHLPLVHHGIATLQQLLGLAGGGNGDALLPVHPVHEDVLRVLLEHVVRAGNPAVLEALLGSRLPFNLKGADPGPGHYTPLSLAAQSKSMACVRLLHEAGAPLTACDLCAAVDRLSPEEVAVLLTCGKPAVRADRPSTFGLLRGGWSCPIHRALRVPFKVCVWRLQMYLGEMRAGVQTHQLAPPALHRTANTHSCGVPQSAGQPRSWKRCGRQATAPPSTAECACPASWTPLLPRPSLLSWTRLRSTTLHTLSTPSCLLGWTLVSQACGPILACSPLLRQRSSEACCTWPAPAAPGAPPPTAAGRSPSSRPLARCCCALPAAATVAAPALQNLMGHS